MMLCKSVIVCVSSGRTPAANAHKKEELSEKWKGSFIVHINWNGYKWFCGN